MTESQKGEREEALEAARVQRSLSYSDALIRQTVAVNPVNLTTSERHLFVLAGEVRRLLSSAKAEGEMREALERALSEIEALQLGRRDTALRIRAALSPKEGT